MSPAVPPRRRRSCCPLRGRPGRRSSCTPAASTRSSSRHGASWPRRSRCRKDIVLAVIDPTADPDNDFDRPGRRPSRRRPHQPRPDRRRRRALEDLDTSTGHPDDEYVTRPYSAESIRWRVEAMCIRSAAVDDGSGPVLQGEIEQADWGRRGKVIAVFNPKGGVGKTMVATNLAAALTQQGPARPARSTPTPSPATSRPRSAWTASPRSSTPGATRSRAARSLTFDQMASVHTSGLQGPAAHRPAR